MLIVSVICAGWTVRHFTLPPKPSIRLGMGLLAFALLLIAEFTLVLWLRGLSITEYFATRDPVAATVYYILLMVFAALPLLVPRK